MEENLSFGYWVRRRRKALDLTQVELGKRVGASAAMIRKIEADERRPSQQLAELLASQLAVPDEESELFIQAARGLVAVENLTITPHPVSEPEPKTLPPSNLPAPLTSMVNRLPDLTLIKSYLSREDARLITITGPPGIGKTRLSIQAAEQVLPDFADGAWFVDLSTVSDPELVLPTVAMTLDLPTEAGSPPSNHIKRMLRDKELLLVLDNLEQVIEQAAMDVSNLLRQCRRVKVLATSRRRLDIYGEHEHTLPPMSVPPPSGKYSPDDLINYEAVQLLVARTRQHRPNFEVTVETATPIAEVCQLMDGLPLALELAAARLRDMPVDALAEALRQASGHDWLALLSWSVRDMPSRQRTLLNAIAWSYTLLEPAQQDMFRQLSVFSGSFDWPAIAAVVDLPALADEAELRATFNQLADHNLVSLVSRVPERWRLLEMIREFARTELDPKAAQIVSQRHANYYLARLIKLDTDSTDADDYLAEFVYEANNCRAALRFALGVADANLAQQLVVAMGGYWEFKGLLDEGRRYLEAVLDMAGTVDDGLRISNLHRATNLAWMQHDFPAANKHISDALELARKREDAHSTVELINLQSRIYLEQGRYRQADLVLSEGLQMESSLPEQIMTPFMLIQQGEAAFSLGELDRAETLTKRGLEAIGSESFIPYCMGWTNLAEIELVCGKIEAAHKALQETIQVVHLHNRRERIFLSAVAGLLLVDRDPPDQAAEIAVRLLSYLKRESDHLGDPLSPMTQQQISERMDRARGIVPPSRWQKLWGEGQDWTTSEARATAKKALSEVG